MKNVLWIFFCLAVAGVCLVVRDVTNRIVRVNDEIDAAWTVHEIRKLQNKYEIDGGGKYAPDFDELRRIGSLDEEFRGEASIVNGYAFRMKVVPPNGRIPASYIIWADPLVDPSGKPSGKPHFYTDSTRGTVHSTREDRPAAPDDPTI